MAPFPFTIQLYGKGVAAARLEERQGLLRRALLNDPLAGFFRYSYHRIDGGFDLITISQVVLEPTSPFTSRD